MLRKIYNKQLSTFRLSLAIIACLALTYVFGSLAVDTGKIIYWLLMVLLITETIDLIAGLISHQKLRMKQDAKTRPNKKRTA